MSVNCLICQKDYYWQDLPQAALPVLFLLTADFWVFRPAGATRCTDQGEIWHGVFGSSMPNFTLIGPGVGVYDTQN